MTTRIWMNRAALGLALVHGLIACGGESPAVGVGATASALAAPNGLTPNGLAMNGLAMNGLARNGLAMNGLARNGLAMNGLARNGLLTAEFQSWFDTDPATAASVMTYVVRCAVPEGQTRSFTSATTGVAYSWSGSLGLAPGWASGLPANLAEQQIITACLAAHVNKYGIHVTVSVGGRGATGAVIPFEAGELATYSVAEAAFFGNLFAGEGVFACSDHKVWSKAASSARACAFESRISGESDCPPIVIADSCQSLCKDIKARWTIGYYESCTWNGVTYLPITTQLRPADVFACGDGICQFTESCGGGTSYDSCRSDCGLCSGTAATSTSTKTNVTTKL